LRDERLKLRRFGHYPAMTELILATSSFCPTGFTMYSTAP
jgi:hypothetical protein